MTSPSGVGTLVGTLVGGRDVVGAAVEGTDVGVNEREGAAVVGIAVGAEVGDAEGCAEG
jgi:hypothetical protein